ncbi:MAG: hypothetical protein BAJALOKI1v1_80010 [Promethearchaeota archaeon]|nr:MAG: hypothetical protein BAJALOKI1v1_80010 [Candidatus Lokiarchaeota archaeon]
MDPIEKKRIIQDIVKKRRLPYSLDLIKVEGNEYHVLNNFGSEMTYIKKDDQYLLEEEM